MDFTETPCCALRFLSISGPHTVKEIQQRIREEVEDEYTDSFTSVLVATTPTERQLASTLARAGFAKLTKVRRNSRGELTLWIYKIQNKKKK